MVVCRQGRKRVFKVLVRCTNYLLVSVGNISGSPRGPLPVPVDKSVISPPVADNPTPVIAERQPEVGELLKDALVAKRTGLVDPKDLKLVNDLLERAELSTYVPPAEELAALKRIIGSVKAGLKGQKAEPPVGDLLGQSVSKMERSSEVALARADAAVSARKSPTTGLQDSKEVKNITKNSLLCGLIKWNKNTSALIDTRETLKGALDHYRTGLAKIELQLKAAPNDKLLLDLKHECAQQIELTGAQLQRTERAIVKRTAARLPELTGGLRTRQTTLSRELAAAFVARNGKTFTISPWMEKSLAEFAQLQERLAKRRAVLEDIAGPRPVQPTATKADKQADVPVTDVPVIPDKHVEEEEQVKLEEEQPENIGDALNELKEALEGLPGFGDLEGDVLGKLKDVAAKLKESLFPKGDADSSKTPGLAAQLKELVAEKGIVFNSDTKQIEFTRPTADGGTETLAVGADAITTTFKGADGTTSTFNYDPHAGKVSGEIDEGDSTVDFQIGRDAGDVSARTSISDIGGSDWGVNLGGEIKWEKGSKDIEGKPFTRHTAQVGLALSADASGTLVGAPVSLGVGASVAREVTWTRSLEATDTKEELLRRNPKPPSLQDLATNPTRYLTKAGASLVQRGSFGFSASAGVADPHSGLRISASASYQAEMIQSFKRLEDDPPGTARFKVRIEPDNNKFQGSVSAGLGPFSVGVGGSKSAAVYYEFEMTEEAVKHYLKTGDMPDIPDPKEYLKKGARFGAEAFKVFDGLNGDRGVKLLRFGSNKATTLTATAGATVVTASTSRTKDKSVEVTEDAVTVHRGKTLSARVDVWFKGARENVLRHVQGYTYRLDESTRTMARSYDGATLSYKINDSKTSREGLQGRLTTANQLFNRKPPNLLALPRGDDFRSTSVTMGAKLTLDGIRALRDLDPTRDNFKIQFTAQAVGVDPEHLLQLIKDLKAIETAPESVTVCGKTAAVRLTPEGLAKKQSTRDQELLSLQGRRITEFLEGSTSIVGEGELGRLAALDRLLDGKLVQVTVRTNVYTGKLDDLAVKEFVSKTPIEPWADYRSLVQKQLDLEEMKTAVQGDTLLMKAEQSELLLKIDGQLGQLSGRLPAIAGSPEQRRTLMKELAGAGGTLGKLGNLSAGSSLAKIAGRFADAPFHVPEARNKAIQGLIAAAGDSVPELAELANVLITKGNEDTDPALVFGILERLHTRGGDRLSNMLGRIADEDLGRLTARLDDTRRRSLLLMTNPADGGKIMAIREGIEEVGRQRVDPQRARYLKQLKSLAAGVTLKSVSGMSGSELAAYYKPLVRSQMALHHLLTGIDADPHLGEQNKLILKEKAQALAAQLDPAIRGVAFLPLDQRKGLFEALVAGGGKRATHKLIDQMLASACGEGSRKKNLGELAHYVHHLAASSKIATEAPRIFSAFQFVQRDSPQALPMLFSTELPASKYGELARRLSPKDAHSLQDWAIDAAQVYRREQAAGRMGLTEDLQRRYERDYQAQIDAVKVVVAANSKVK